MNPIIAAAIISTSGVVVSAGVALTGVVITIRAQTRHIDADNRAALATQTGEIKEHLKARLGGPPQAPPEPESGQRAAP